MLRTEGEWLRDLRLAERRISNMVKAALSALVVLSALVALPAASAKDFQPGDLSVCNSTRCVAVVNREVLPLLGSFYYGRTTLARVRRPRLRTSYYQLRFRNGYVTGIIATQPLDRFLSYSLNLGRFARNRWYRAPKRCRESSVG